MPQENEDKLINPSTNYYKAFGSVYPLSQGLSVHLFLDAHKIKRGMTLLHMHRQIPQCLLFLCRRHEIGPDPNSVCAEYRAIVTKELQKM